MDYSDFSCNDFARDKDFIKWVLYPTINEDEKWNQWIMLNPDKKGEIDEARRIVALMHFKPIPLSTEKIEKIRKNYKGSIARSSKEGSFLMMPAPLLKVAASIAIVGAVFWLVYTNLNYFGAYKEVSTGNGQRIFVNLPDGSKVWLNGGSSLKYSKNLDENDVREVYLEGEAFFEVAKNPKRPFLVTASKMIIKVVGTSFNVRSYQEDETIETTLLEGKVLIDTKGDKQYKDLILKPNQKAVFIKESEKVELSNANAHALASWKNGSLIIDNETLASTIKKMERWFGTDIEIQSGGNCRISLKIEGESLTDILELMQLTTKIKYKINRNKVLLDVECDR